MRIIVIGGGVIGLACGWKLARRGAEVILFDSGKTGEGASLAALGALWPPGELHSGALPQLHRKSLWLFEQFIDELSDATDRSIPFLRGGRVEFVASQNAAARARVEVAAAVVRWPSLRADCAPQEILEASDVKRLLPFCAPAEYGALLCHNTAQVDIPSLLRALRNVCVATGVVVHEDTRVRAIVDKGVRTDRETHHANAVLVTTGASTSALLPSVRIAPVKGQALALERPANLTRSPIVKNGSTYLVPWQNEILVGATTEPAAGFDACPTSIARDMLLASAAALIPELATAKLLRHWTGLRPQSITKQPVMGRLPGSPSHYVCSGHYKIGVAMAPVVSDLMAELILEGTTPTELLPFLPQ